MKHGQRHIEDLPHIPISPKNDIATLDSAIKQYLASLPRHLLSQAQLRQIQVLQNLRRRLAEVPPDTKGMHGSLTVEEVTALDAAIAGCIVLAQCSNQPSKERDAQLQRFAAFRQDLQRML
ncbi:MAG: hypothetical protein JO202_18730 [Ktedonobacteraceae bacterium]|nr:hypothetical protein [Ktedonobacteraceae bacterium]